MAIKYGLPFLVSNGMNIQADEIKEFWVVTYPSGYSSIDDICFKSSIPGMMLQKAGGLEYRDLAGIFKTRKKAESFAKKLIQQKWI